MEITYPDGSTELVEIPVTVIPTPPTDAEKYDPIAETEVVEEGGTVDLTDNITNIDDLPEGTTVTDITPEGTIDTSTPGNYTGQVEITYPDGSTEVVDVPVTVTEKPPTDAEKYDPIAETEVIDKGEDYDLTDNIVNIDELPEGTKVVDVTPEGTIDTSKPGNYTGTVEIQYPDGTKETVQVPVTVKETDTGKWYIDEDTGVKIWVPAGAFDGQIYLHVIRVTESHRDLYPTRQMEAYEIYWTRDPEGLGERIQPKVMVRVIAPMGETTYNDFRLEHLNADGSLTAYAHTLETAAKTVTFLTDEFSIYVLSSAKVQKPVVKPETKPTQSGNVKTGDAGLIAPIATLAMAAAGLYVTAKKRKDDEEM